MSNYNPSDLFAVIFASSFFIIYLIIFLVMILFVTAICVFAIICNWKLLEKAGEPGWKALIPFYSYYVATDFSLTKPTSLVAFIVFTAALVITPCSAIPWVGILVGSLSWLAIVLANGVLNFGMAKAFGQDIALCVLAIFFAPIIRAILAFSKKIEYTGDKLTIFK